MALKRYDLHSDWTGAAMKEHPTGEYVEFDDVEHLLLGHDQFKTGDAGAPDQIKDANGEVVLAMCKRCEGAESELDTPCAERLAKQVEELVHAVADKDVLLDRLRPYVQSVIDSLEDEVDHEMCHTEAQRGIQRQIGEAEELLKLLPLPVDSQPSQQPHNDKENQ